MKKTASFTTATAIALLMSTAAFADENFSNVVQDGFDNSGVVTQGPGDLNQVGTNADAALQSGSDNMLDILQSGNGNEVGTDGTGFGQDSNRNTAAITQTSNANKVLQVQQTGIASGSGGVSLRRNTLTIDQGGGDGNTISRVTQTRTSGFFGNGEAGNIATLTQSGGGNIIGAASVTADGVLQTGRRHMVTVEQENGDANAVVNLFQSGIGEQVEVIQSGHGNRLERIDQRGSRNSADLSFTGNNNGNTGFDQSSRVNAPWVSLSQGYIYQNNDFFGSGFVDANLLGFTVAGDDNSFGFDQSGGANSINGEVQGSNNQTGAAQLGLGNATDFFVAGSRNHVYVNQALAVINIDNSANVLIDGDENAVGAVQNGTNNGATVTIGGGLNTVNIFQESLILGNTASVAIQGDSNDVALEQSGNNVATLSIQGHSNLLDAGQTGLANALTVNIWGNDNNRGDFTGGLPAAAFATTAGLLPGQIIQNGGGNSISMDVGSDVDPTSNSNLFAFLQSGEDNGIVGVVLGNGNQAVIVQEGENNFTSFSQVGNFNNIGVNQ